MKHLKLLMLFCLGAFIMASTAVGQEADPYIQVLPKNSGKVSVGANVDLIITVGNTKTGSIAVSKLRPIIQVPTSVSFLSEQTDLPAGWSILSNTGSQLRLCNSNDVIPGQTSRTIILKVQGVSIAPATTFSGNINFGNGSTCAAGTSVSGDLTANNSATSTIEVIAASSCTLTASASAGTISCFGSTTTLTASISGASTFGTPEYSINGINYQSANTFTVNGSGSPYTVRVREQGTVCTATAAPVNVSEPNAIVANASNTNNTSNTSANGTATVTASGGAGGFTYLWSPGGQTTATATGLTGGTYTVGVTDANGCTQTATTTVATSITVDPAVGQMFFTNTSNVLQSANTLLFPSVYKLKVPFYNLNQTNIVPSGTIKVKINLGSKLNLDSAFSLATAPLNNYFTWSSATVVDSVIITGTQIAAIPADFNSELIFNVKGKLSCTSNVNAQISIVNPVATLNDEDLQNNNALLQYTLPVTVTTTQVNTCNGSNNGIINVVASPGTIFEIRNAANIVVGNTNLAPGVYTITATATGDAPLSNSCSNTASVTIVQSLVTVNTTNVTNNVCNGGNVGSFTASTTGGTSPYTYVITGPTVNTTGATTGVFTNLLAGTYTVTSTNVNGCTATSTATIGQPTGTVSDVTLGSDISGTLFLTSGVSKTIVYNVTEIAGNSAVGDTIRITNPSGFTIDFNSSLTSATIGSSTYVLDNSRWKIDNSNPAFTSIILTDPSNASNPGTLLCSQRLNVSVTLTRNTTNISTFTLSTRFRKANGELNLNNNLNSIIFTAE
jgi:hypothetical protein